MFDSSLFACVAGRGIILYTAGDRYPHIASWDVWGKRSFSWAVNSDARPPTIMRDVKAANIHAVDKQVVFMGLSISGFEKRMSSG